MKWLWQLYYNMQFRQPHENCKESGKCYIIAVAESLWCKGAEDLKSKGKSKVLLIWFILLALSIALMLSVNYFFDSNHGKGAPLCQKGVMNLSNWDFDRNGNVKLNGDWEFYPNKLLSPKDLHANSRLQALYVKVPNPWLSQKTKDVISDKGVGTYRLRVKTNSSIYMYGLKTTNIRSSCKIFVNGKELGQSGNPALSFKEGYVGNVIPIVVFFPAQGDTLDILIQVANLDYYNGGIIQNIYLGSEKNILEYYFKMNFLNIMSTAFMVLSSIYYFGIYIRRRKDKRLIYLSIVCLAYSYVAATDGEKIFSRIFDFLPFMLVLKLKIALISLSIIFIALFIREMGKELIPSKYMKVILIIAGSNMALIFAAPKQPIFFFEYLTGFLNMSLYILMGVLIFSAIARGKYGSLNRISAIFLLVGVILNIFSFISAGLYFSSVIKSNIAPLFMTVFLLFGIAVMLAEQYATAYMGMEAMSRKLMEADKLKDEFLINTSHEFKTPLHGIINIAQGILDQKEGGGAKKQRENLAYIIALATRLSGLVNDIMDFQGLQNRNLRLSKKIFDINGNVQAAIEVLKHMRKGEDIKLVNAIPAGKYHLYADENRFQQIIMNLLSNSLKYTEMGYVEVRADKADGYVYVSVEDTGMGIDENVQNELFRRNADVGETNFTQYSSSGLGLSISKLLACNMGGDLYLQWSEANKGSIFVIKLPEADEYENTNIGKMSSEREDLSQELWEEEASAALEQYWGKGSGQNLKVLLVDDEPSNIKVLQEIFNEENYETIVAYSGFKALELMKKHKDISLVLLDVMMPGMSGYEVCKKIRQEYPLFELPILLLTVRNTPEDVEAGLKAGANDFLIKPFDARELKARAGTLQHMKKAVENAIKMETVFLQSQIRPHFLYNALSVIMSLCYKDGERAGDLLVELSNYLRCSFDIDPHNSFISLEKEISCVKSYAELEKARFGDRLTVYFDVEDRLLSYRIPALTIQPMVENSIRHGLMKRITGGTVKISVRLNSNEMEITVQDDGVGMSPEKLEMLLDNDLPAGGIGLKNVNKRLLNEYGKGLSIKSQEGEGTRVEMSIPVKEAYWEQEGTGYDESHRDR